MNNSTRSICATRLTDLCLGQWGIFWQWAEQTGKPVAQLLEEGKFSPDPWYAGAITGILPSGLFGLIEPDGRVNT
jgi:hypothetical protein